MTTRETMYQAIQETCHQDDDLEGSVLTGFLVVAEWRAPDGEFWLSKISGDHGASLPPWRQRGLAGEVVNDFWNDQSEGTDG